MTILNPVSGSTVRGPVIIRADVSGRPNISKVEFLIDGVLVCTVNKAPWEHKWNTGTNYIDNQHSIYVKAYDIDGNSFGSTSIVKISQNSPPRAWFSITPECGLSGAVFYFDARETVDTEDGADQLRVRWDWEGDGIWDTQYNYLKSESYIYDIPATYNPRIEVMDRDGLTDVEEHQVIVKRAELDYPPTVTDVEGNTYRTIMIGSQLWMAENLKVTRFRDGGSIPLVAKDSRWVKIDSPAYCAYDNSEANIEIHGLLYNWFAVSSGRNIAPTGWHVPTDKEWHILEMHLGMSMKEASSEGFRGTKAGNSIREAGFYHWDRTDIVADNSSGFSALPSGYRNYKSGGFAHMNQYSYFWTSTEKQDNYAWYRSVNSYSPSIGRSYIFEDNGFSVRCIKDSWNNSQ